MPVACTCPDVIAMSSFSKGLAGGGDFRPASASHWLYDPGKVPLNFSFFTCKMRGGWTRQIAEITTSSKVQWQTQFTEVWENSPGEPRSYSKHVIICLFFFLSLISYKVVFVFLSTHFIFFNPVLSNSGFWYQIVQRLDLSLEKSLFNSEIIRAGDFGNWIFNWITYICSLLDRSFQSVSSQMKSPRCVSSTPFLQSCGTWISKNPALWNNQQLLSETEQNYEWNDLDT